MSELMPQEKSSAWVAIGESAEFEDCLIGNKEGLTQLRDAISEALSNGEAHLLPRLISMTKVLVLDGPTNPETIPRKRSWKDTLALVSCAIVIFPIGLLLVLGLMSLFKKGSSLNCVGRGLAGGRFRIQ